MPEIFQPGQPHIGFSGRDQDKPGTGLQIGNSQALQEMGALLAGDQGFENTPNADGREYNGSIKVAGLAARIASLESKAAVGAEYVDPFNRGNTSGSLGSPDPGVVPNWILFGDGQAMGIIDNAAQLYRDAFLGLVDDGVRYALCPQAASANDYAVTVVIHPRVGENRLPVNAFTGVYGRCNAAGTEGVYLHLFGNRCTLGRFARNNLSMTYTEWASGTRTYSPGSTIEMKMVGTRYQVVVDGVVSIDVVNETFPVDGNHRFSMFSLHCWTGLFRDPEFSGTVEQFSIRGANADAIAQATTAAQQATTAAGNAEAAAGAVLGIAENADAKATQAQDTANAALDSVQDALNGAQQTGKEFMVASAGVVLGRNEVNIGPSVVVPPSREFRATSVTYGLEQNTGGITIELLKVSPTRVATVMHTATIPANQLEYQATGLNIPVENRYRYACNVTGLSGNAAVLLCSVDGALL